MKSTYISVGVALCFIATAVFLGKAGSLPSDKPLSSNDNVTMEGDTQIVSITARGGYSPRVSEAKAGIPTTIRVETDGTYDCSASLVIPSAKYQGFLKPKGIEEIKIPSQEMGSEIRGLCSMGMYSFLVKFN